MMLTGVESRLAAAENFLLTCHRELGTPEPLCAARLEQVRAAILSGAPYDWTPLELEHGARMAWRNSNRCIGRLFWKTLTVFDRRGLTSADDILDALLEHIAFATNDGRIRPAITVFAAPGEHGGIRIWNHQLIRYAGYSGPGSVIGDPHSIAFTAVCQQLGWSGQRTPFDVLPLVVQTPDGAMHMRSLPPDSVREVAIAHPTISGIAQLGLKWYAVPLLSDMALEIGGITYTAAPFNGWYMGTEIGARNLADTERYDVLPELARILQLDTSSSATLWQDRALVELNVAVLHSYREAGVRLVDHHTAAQQFRLFEEAEAQAGRQVTGDWSWLIPPLSPATTHIFHTHYDDSHQSPNFVHQDRPY